MLLFVVILSLVRTEIHGDRNVQAVSNLGLMIVILTSGDFEMSVFGEYI